MSGPEVPAWDAGNSLEPELGMIADATAHDVLNLLAAALAAQGFRIGDKDAGGFEARFRDWWGWAAGSLGSTALTVSVLSSDSVGGGAAARVAARSSGPNRKARRRAAAGLSEAVRRRRAGGSAVQVSPWRGLGHPDRG